MKIPFNPQRSVTTMFFALFIAASLAAKSTTLVAQEIGPRSHGYQARNAAGGIGTKTTTIISKTRNNRTLKKPKSNTVSPTSASSPAPTAAVCEDSTERFSVNNVTQSCAWVVRGGGPKNSFLPWRCTRFPEAAAACKQTCGACGCTDTSKRFSIPGDKQKVKRSCAWVARTSTAKRCAMDGVRFYCPETCGNCAPPPLPPCPPVPELAGVVDTPAKCACFYALAASGLDSGEESTFGNAFNEDSVQYFPQTGAYYGADGIAEYLSFVQGGVFVKDYILVGQPIFLDMTGSTMEQCVATVAEHRRLPFNKEFTVDNLNVTVDVLAVSRTHFQMTGNPLSSILVNQIDVWLPDELISETFPLLSGSLATTAFVCNVITNTCNGQVGMETCMQMYSALPNYEVVDGFSYIDGDSKGCRILHSAFAIVNPLHCPHVSFEKEIDQNGFFKCSSPAGKIKVYDLFAPELIAGFLYVGNTLMGLGETGIKITIE